MDHGQWSYSENTDIFDDGNSNDSDNSLDDEEQPQHLNPSVVIIGNPADVDVSDDDDGDLEVGETDSDDNEESGSRARNSRPLSNSTAQSATNPNSDTSARSSIATNEANLNDGTSNNDEVVSLGDVIQVHDQPLVNPGSTAVNESDIIVIADEDEDREDAAQNATSQNGPASQQDHSTNQDTATSPVMTIPDEGPMIPARKRKRSSSRSPISQTPTMKSVDSDDDDGLTCPICLDNWEMSGNHRLVALRCGHLFGDICIRRWLSESSRQSGCKVCPQCKTKASPKDIRCLYARRVRGIDRTEEHSLREMLTAEKRKVALLENENLNYRKQNASFKNRIDSLEKDNERMKKLISSQQKYINSRDCSGPFAHLLNYKIYLDRTIDVCREPGCRVMTFSDRNRCLLMSQKSGQKLFPGYGVRFVDTGTFRTSHYIPASSKLIRDLCVNYEQSIVAVASMEPTSRIFDMKSGNFVSQFTINNISPLWCCNIDTPRNGNNLLYLGAQIGTTYIYDLRYPTEALHDYSQEGDNSPVIKIAQIPASSICGGGFLVCTLRNLWLYENVNADQPLPTRLNVEGPFISMDYNSTTGLILLTTRSNACFANSRYLLGNLERQGEVLYFNVKIVFFGAKATPIMTRPSQIVVEGNTLVSGYVQDAKLLSLYDVGRESRIQAIPVQDVVFDTCPIYAKDNLYLAALTESKCRIYKVVATD